MKNSWYATILFRQVAVPFLGDRINLFCTTFHTTLTRDRQCLSKLFRLVRPVLWSGVKAVGKESLRTDSKILSDIADTDRKPSDINASHVGESAQNLIQKLRCRGVSDPPPYGDYLLKRRRNPIL
jgi:hypothetical protein